MAKYEDAAAAAHIALHHDSNWNWKTLSKHYATTKDYTTQLRNLETSITNSSTAEKRFLIAYHYLMLGQPKAARAQFQRVAKAKPDDKLVAKLLQNLEKEKSSEC